MMSPLSVLSAVIVVLSLPWASTASCLCSISGDPHISTCDTKTTFAWQGAGAYSLFKTPDAELQCDFTYPQYDNGTVIHQMFTYVSSCRLSYKTSKGCEFTMLTGGNNDQQSIYIGNTKMALADVMPYVQKNLPSMGINIDVDVPNAKTTCTMQTQQGPIAFEIAPYQVHVTTAGASQCNGLCGTCDGQAPLRLNLSDANSISTFATSFAADGSSRIAPILLQPLPIGCVNNNGSLATPSPNNGTVALGQNSTNAPSNSTPSASTPLNSSSTPSSNDMTSTPSSAPGASPAPGQTPVTGPGSPATAPGSTPTFGSGSTPAPAPGSSPMTAPGSSPMTAPGSSPMTAPGSSPMTAPGSSPMTAPGSSPTTAPGSAPSAPGSSPTFNTSAGSIPSASSSPAPFNGSTPSSDSALSNGTQSNQIPAPAKVTQMNPAMVNDMPVFESPAVLRKVIDQCLCGQPKSRYYSDALFGRYFENCVYDKSFPGAEMLALSNMMTLHRTISKGFTQHNASLTPLDINTCKMMILQRVVTKRPDQIPLGEGVSYVPIYTKQNSTGVMDARPTLLTGTGETADECELDQLGASSNAMPIRTWTRGAQPAGPTTGYTPSNTTQAANSSMAMNSTNGSTDFAYATSTN